MIRYSAATARTCFGDDFVLNVQRTLIRYAVIVPKTQPTDLPQKSEAPTKLSMTKVRPKSTTAAMTPEMMKRVICTISP